MRPVSIFCLSAFLFASAIAPASALIVDFTDSGAYGPGNSAAELSETYGLADGPVTVSLLPNDGSLSFTAFDGNASVNSNLAFDYDGIGIGDDEITNNNGAQEAVTVNFSRTVKILGFYFLDLYAAVGIADAEVAEVYRDGALVGLFTADLLFQQLGGYKHAIINPILADSLVFRAATGNDNVGLADYALAGIDIAPVPIPAALPLFLTGLAGLGYLGRRKKPNGSPVQSL